MHELNSGEWVCPVCETINTGSTCIICGTEKIQGNTTPITEEKIPGNDIPEPAENGEDVPDEPQYKKWQRILAIVLILVTVVMVFYLLEKI